MNIVIVKLFAEFSFLFIFILYSKNVFIYGSAVVLVLIMFDGFVR